MIFVPQVSVVMSVYNGAEYLTDTLDSVLSQQGCDLEFIVVNDGSKDETAAILDACSIRDSRMRVFHQENTGLTRALMRGCSEARGEFIARQDAGDISLPGRLKGQIAALSANEDLAFVSCHAKYITPSGAYLYSFCGTGLACTPLRIIDVSMPYGVIDGPSHHGSVMFRRGLYNKVGGYRPQFYFGQDWDLWYRLALSGEFQMLCEILYVARIGLSDISSTNRHLQEQLARLSLQSLKRSLSNVSDEDVLIQASAVRPQKLAPSARVLSRGAYFLGECLRRNGDKEHALEYLARAVKENPLNLKAWCRLLQIAVCR